MKLLILALAVAPFPAWLVGRKWLDRVQRAKAEALFIKDALEVWYEEHVRGSSSSDSSSSSSQLSGGASGG
jgi:hypothetical protein